MVLSELEGLDVSMDVAQIDDFQFEDREGGRL